MFVYDLSIGQFAWVRNEKRTNKKAAISDSGFRRKAEIQILHL